jgi:hypothetical protein
VDFRFVRMHPQNGGYYLYHRKVGGGGGNRYISVPGRAEGARGPDYVAYVFCLS